MTFPGFNLTFFFTRQLIRSFSFFITFHRCIIEDGTGEGYLQIEHTLLRRFLSLSDDQWKHIQMVAEKDEIIYQRDDKDGITVQTTRPDKQVCNFLPNFIINFILAEFYPAVQFFNQWT